MSSPPQSDACRVSTPLSAAGPEIIILGGPDDAHAGLCARALGERGADVLLLDLEPFPLLLPLGWADGVPTWRGARLDGVRAVYVRTVHMRLPFFALDLAAREGAGPADLLAIWRAGYAAERERQSFLAAFVLAFERAGARVVNPVATLDQHFVKLDQLAILRAAGVPVPRTLATNDAEAVRAFAAEAGPLVVKPLAGGERCRRLDPREPLEELARAPMLFQEEAPGRDARVYVAGGRVVAAYEIETHDAAEVDFRGREKAVRPVALAPAIEAACLRAAAACGMLFTGIDVRVASPERFAVLECNPSPMFEGFERAAGGERTVMKALCELLLAAT